LVPGARFGRDELLRDIKRFRAQLTAELSGLKAKGAMTNAFSSMA
jgi:hypothetical protein